MRFTSMVLAFGALLLMPLAARPGQIEVTCGVCSVEAVPASMRQAHVQFTAVVSGRVGALGELLELKVILAPDWLGRDALLKCVRRWRARGLAGRTPVTVALVWKWGAWHRMSIAAGHAKYEVTLEPDAGGEDPAATGS
jgi:hypothetical protein